MPVHCFGCTKFGSLSKEAGRRLYLYGPIPILQKRCTVKQDKSWKYERMCSQEYGRRAECKSCSIDGVGVDVDNENDLQFKTIIKWTNKNLLEAAELESLGL